MTIEQECREAEEVRRERRERVLAGQSKGDSLWKKYKGANGFDRSTRLDIGSIPIASTLEYEYWARRNRIRIFVF